jgi:uncharacterized membrane-anchored protein YhcB (DUF1043 family)
MDTAKEAKIEELKQQLEETHTSVMSKFAEVAEILRQIKIQQ